MSYTIKPEDVPASLVASLNACEGSDFMDAGQIAAIVESAIEAGLVSPPCYYIAYPSGMPVMHEPGEPIQIFPGKCSNPHERHWKGQTE